MSELVSGTVLIAYGAMALAGYAGVKSLSNTNGGTTMSHYDSYQWEREQRHREYLERQARREENHRAYLQRQAAREQQQREYKERQVRRNAKHQAYLQRQESQRQANREAFFERVSANVLRFRDQYTNTLNGLASQGFEQYLSKEFTNIRSQISRIDILLASDDVEAARDLSVQLGNEVHSLAILARSTKREDMQTEQQRKVKLAETRREAQSAFIEQIKQNLETDTNDNPEAVKNAVQALEVLKMKAADNTFTAEDLQEHLIAESDKVDGEIADETIRREVVKSVYQSLKKTGFIVSNPQLNGDVVVIKAQKTAGQQAEFAVKLNGGLDFKFDRYEGRKCKKDIDEVTAMLDECYGVKLSDRKIIWENPDRIQKGSKELPTGDDAKLMNG